MKSIIIVDIDTERDETVQIGKPQGGDLPKNKEEAEEMILRDMSCLCEAVCTLIYAADQSGYKTTADSLKDCIAHLESGTVEVSKDVEGEDLDTKI